MQSNNMQSKEKQKQSKAKQILSQSKANAQRTDTVRIQNMGFLHFFLNPWTLPAQIYFMQFKQLAYYSKYVH